MASSAQRVCARAARAVLMSLGLACVLPGMSVAQTPGMPEHKNMMAWSRTLFVLVDQLDYAPRAPERPIDADARAWYGGAYNRLWFRGQGEFDTTRRGDSGGEAELLYGLLVAPFWDAVVGVHVDQHWGGTAPSRTLLALGFVGLAPYRFELQPTLYVSQRGEVSGRIEAAIPLLLTQRLVAEPEIELNVSLQAIPQYDLRRGLNDYEMGVRLRYEFWRQFAPYIGVSRSRRLGVRSQPSELVQTRFVSGIRMWR